MNKVSLAVAPLLAAMVLATPLAPALAQGMRAPRWNPGTVETFKGTVAAERDLGRLEMHAIAVKTDGGTRLVVLGPRDKIDPDLVALVPPAEVEITGSKAQGEQGRSFYLASAVKTGGKQYRIRDDQGRLLDKDGKPLRP